MNNFAAIDFETANHNHSSVCSVGIVIVCEGRIVDKIYRLIRPEPEWYSWRFTEIHGLCADDTASEKCFPQVWEEIAPKIEGLPLVAHNKDILDKYSRKHVIVRNPVEKWIADITAAQWTSINDLRTSFPSADYVGNGRIVFNIKGNDYRLIVIVLFVINVVEIRWIGTHAEYDKIKDCSII